MNFIYIGLLMTSIAINASHIVALSIPKSGSHLLYKCINLLTEKEPKHAYHAATFIDWDNSFVTNHELPTEQAIAGYQQQNIRAVFIYRDPRDQVVSSAYFFKEKLKHPRAMAMEMPELITDIMYNSSMWWKYVVFVGVELPYDTSVKVFYDSLLPWAQQPCVYTTTFEKLVGPKGGGDREQQIKEIMNIAKHIGDCPISDDHANQIADQLFGRFETFREGKIGAWKECFTADHKKLFKEIAGDLLITLGYEADMQW